MPYLKPTSDHASKNIIEQAVHGILGSQLFQKRKYYNILQHAGLTNISSRESEEKKYTFSSQNF